MSELRFRLWPAPQTITPWLPYAYIFRSAECCPVCSTVELAAEELVFRMEEDGGPVAASIPWPVGDEIWMLSTTTLLADQRPYDLLRELARGQLHRVRSIVSEWSEAGLALPKELDVRLHRAIRELLTSAQQTSSASASSASQTLHIALETGQALTLEVARHIAQARSQRDRNCFYLSWSADLPHQNELLQLREVFQGIRLALPFDLRAIQDNSFWHRLEEILRRIRQHGWQVSLGPVFDFASERFLGNWRLAENGEEFLEAAGLFLNRAMTFAEEVEDWYLIAASNFLPPYLYSEQGLALLGKLLRLAKQILAGKSISVGLAQPYGERAARSTDQPVPLLLADWLSRADLGLTALDLELLFACEPRGSLLRPPWSINQLLDWFAEIQPRLHITLGLPAAPLPDPLADPPDQEVLPCANEVWQATWTSALLDLTLAHPNVQRITWLDASDAAPHVVPHGGIFDKSGQPRRILEAFRLRRPAALR